MNEAFDGIREKKVSSSLSSSGEQLAESRFGSTTGPVDGCLESKQIRVGDNSFQVFIVVELAYINLEEFLVAPKVYLL